MSKFSGLVKMHPREVKRQALAAINCIKIARTKEKEEAINRIIEGSKGRVPLIHYIFGMREVAPITRKEAEDWYVKGDPEDSWSIAPKYWVDKMHREIEAELNQLLCAANQAHVEEMYVPTNIVAFFNREW